MCERDESQKRTIRAAFAAAGAVPVFLAVLREGNPNARSSCCYALTAICFEPTIRSTLNAGEAIPLLIARLSTEFFWAARVPPMRLLILLAEDNPQFSTAIVEAGVIPPLLEILKGTMKNEGNFYSWIEVAVDLLHQLAVDTANQRAIVAGGGIAPLVRVLNAGLFKAGDVLCTLIFLPEHRRLIVQGGTIAPLLRIYYTRNTIAKENCMLVLWQLAEDNENRKTIAGATVPMLVKSLTNGSEVAKERAAGALGELAKHEPNKNVIVKSGAIPVLSNLLKESSGGMRATVADTLRTLSGDSKVDKAIAKAGVLHLL